MRQHDQNRLRARPAHEAPFPRIGRSSPLLIIVLLLAACGGSPTPPGQTVAVSVAPTALQLQPGDSAAIVATVTGASETGVTWQATGGSIAGTGNTVTYTAPDEEGTFTVTARSTADTGKTATTTVQVGAGSAPFDGWVRQFGSHLTEEATSVAVDPDDNVIVVGVTNSTMPGGTRIGMRDAFVVKFAADGTQLWLEQIGSPENDDAVGVAVDAGGHIFVAGTTFGLMGNDGDYVGLSDAYVRKLDADGAPLWTTQFGTSNYDFVSNVAVDADGNVIVIGMTQGLFPGNSKSSALDGFAAKFDTDGAQLWVTQFGTSGQIVTVDVAVGADGSVFVVGNTAVAMPGTIGHGDNDAFLVKLDAEDGAPDWYRMIGSEDAESAYGIAVTGDGNIIIAGVTDGVMAGDDNAGHLDIFVSAYSPAGTPLWNQQFGSTMQDRGWSVAVDADDGIYVVGGTRGEMPGNTSDENWDLFAAKLETDGAIAWIRQFDSNGGDDEAFDVAVDGAGNVIIAGKTTGTMPGYTKVGGHPNNDDGFVISLRP